MKVITVTSGKGGVGKTNISVNLAVAMALQGYKVCLFDADIGLANVNILMGIEGKHTLEDVISGDKQLKDVIIQNWNGIDIIPGSSGVEHFESAEQAVVSNVIKDFARLEKYDYMVVDTGAGIGKAVASFCLASSIMILTIVPEPTSLTDGYSLLKVLAFNGFKNSANIIVNRSKSSKFGEKVFEKFYSSVAKYMDIKLNYLGMVAEDEKVVDSVISQFPFILKYPEAKASLCVKNIASQIINKKDDSFSEEKTMGSFIQSWTAFFQSRLKITEKSSDKNTPKKKRTFFKKEKEAEGYKKSFERDLITLVSSLVEKTDKISSEIDFLKKFMNADKKGSYFFDNQVMDDESELSAPVLSLDFKRFVQTRKLK